jgi:NADH dehydrogenase
VKHIVILGGGFGGTSAARVLDRAFRNNSGVDITLINRENYMVFTPLMAEVVGNTVEGRHAVPPLRAFFHKVRFQAGEVRCVDVAAQRVTVEYFDGRQEQLPYDYLILALGSITNYHHVSGAVDHSFDLKSLNDAIRLRNHIIRLLEEADICDDPQERQALLTFVAAGGGYAGVEGLGHIIDLIHKALRYYPSIKPSDLRFILASHGPRLLTQINDRLGMYTEHALRQRGVDVRTGVSVTGVTERSATLDPGGTVPTRTVVWAAGITLSPFVQSLDLPKDTHGALQVDSCLQVVGHPNVFALGDCAAVPQKGGGTYAPTAQNATREGKTAARNVIAAMRGGRRRAFRFQPLGSLASLGHYEAVAQLGPVSLAGFMAWLAWRSVYLVKLPEMGRRVRVAVDWLVDLLLSTDIVQLPVLPNDDVVADPTPDDPSRRDQRG